METATTIQPGVLPGLGIKSIYPDITGMSIPPSADCKLPAGDLNTTQNGWRLFKESHSLASLWKLFKDIKVISFCEWTNLAHATDTWDGLLSDVIRPLEGKDRMFIFQLGDVRSKKFFEVDEILDIISDFSMHGRVSVVLDKQEADNLSELLHGKSISVTDELRYNPGSDYRYDAIFQTMHIDQLLISVDDSILVHQTNRQFELPGNATDGKEAAIQAAIHL